MDLDSGWASNLMSKCGVKGNIKNEDLMIIILNNLPEEYDMILNGFESGLASSGPNTLTIEVISKKTNKRYEKLETKTKEKIKGKCISGLWKTF